jgi:excisionase family DNA binding protein
VNAPHELEAGSQMSAEEGWVGVAEVAAYLRVARESVYRWVVARGFPARRVGRLLRFRLSEVDEWVRKGCGDGSTSDSSNESTASGAKPTRSGFRKSKKTKNG